MDTAVPSFPWKNPGGRRPACRIPTRLAKRSECIEAINRGAARREVGTDSSNPERSCDLERTSIRASPDDLFSVYALSRARKLIESCKTLVRVERILGAEGRLLLGYVIDPEHLQAVTDRLMNLPLQIAFDGIREGWRWPIIGHIRTQFEDSLDAQ